LQILQEKKMNLLTIFGLYFIQDVMFSSYHFLIDCFEFEFFSKYGFTEIETSRKHHNFPTLRGEDTISHTSIMPIHSTLAQFVGMEIFHFVVFGSFFNPNRNGLFFIFVIGWFGFMNHKYVHSNQIPKPWIIAQKCKIVMDRKYHAIHHQSEDGHHFGFISGWLDIPMQKLYKWLPVYIRTIVPLLFLFGGIVVNIYLLK
jgi:Lipid desaturase domain